MLYLFNLTTFSQFQSHENVPLIKRVVPICSFHLQKYKHCFFANISGFCSLQIKHLSFVTINHKNLSCYDHANHISIKLLKMSELNIFC